MSENGTEILGDVRKILALVTEIKDKDAATTLAVQREIEVWKGRALAAEKKSDAYHWKAQQYDALTVGKMNGKKPPAPHNDIKAVK